MLFGRLGMTAMQVLGFSVGLILVFVLAYLFKSLRVTKKFYFFGYLVSLCISMFNVVFYYFTGGEWIKKGLSLLVIETILWIFFIFSRLILDAVDKHKAKQP